MKWGRVYLSFCLAIMTLEAACAPGSPAVVRPGDFDSLDPEVLHLIERLASRAEASTGDSGPLADLCLAYEANQLWGEARDCYLQLLELEPGHPDYGLHLAVVTRESGDTLGSLEILRQQALQHPASASLQQRLAQALLENGELDAAESAFVRLVELRPGSAHGRAGLGAVYLQRGDYRKAIQVLEEALRQSPRLGAAHYLLGTAYRKAGRMEEAKRELDRGLGSAVGYLPDSLTARMEEYRVSANDRLLRAGDLLRSGRPAQAAELLEKATAAQPDNVTGLNNLAVAYIHLGRLEDAARVLEQSRQIDPEKFSTYLNLASLARRQGRFQQALGFADAAVGLAPELSQPHYAAAQALAELGSFEEALERVRKVLEIDSHLPQNHTFAGDLCFQLKRYPQARGYFLQALEIDPSFLPARLGQIRAAWGLGRREEARAALELARQQAPRNPQVQHWQQRLSEERP